MSSIFTKITKGEIPCYKIAEDENNFAFLDINPLTKGHTLVVPKKETDYIFDLRDEEFASLQLFSKTVAHALKNAVPCVRVGSVVIGLEVPHAHIHLIPFNNISDMNFSNPKLKLTKDQFEILAAEIRRAF